MFLVQLVHVKHALADELVVVVGEEVPLGRVASVHGTLVVAEARLANEVEAQGDLPDQNDHRNRERVRFFDRELVRKSGVIG